MSWTYSVTLTAAKDKVRWYTQDTNTNEQLVQDEEITFALSEKSQNILQTSALVAEIIARKFGRQATITTPDLRADLGQRAAFYWSLAQDLRTRTVAVSPFIGGISIDNKETYVDDEDRVRPLFEKDQFVVPGTGTSEPAIARGGEAP